MTEPLLLHSSGVPASPPSAPFNLSLPTHLKATNFSQWLSSGRRVHRSCWHKTRARRAMTSGSRARVWRLGFMPLVALLVSTLTAAAPVLRVSKRRHRATDALDADAQFFTKQAVACMKLQGKQRALPLRTLGLPLHAGRGQLIQFNNTFTTDARSSRDTVVGLPPVHPPVIPADIGSRFNSCAVVGNSGSLLSAERGREIDGHSVVFRVNQAPAGGRYVRHVGTRTHFRLLNAKWSAVYASARKSYALERGVTLIASRGDSERNYAHLARTLRTRRPDVRVTLLQHSALARARAMLAAFRRCAEFGGRVYGGGRVPTSGLVLVFNLKDICGQTSVYGFGGDAINGRRAKYQYFTGSGALSAGDVTHCFPAELDLLHSLAASNYIRLCSASACTGTGTNKS